MGVTRSHNSTIQSRDCSSELDFATLTIKPDTIGQHVTRPIYQPCIGQHVDRPRSLLDWQVCQTILGQHLTNTLAILRWYFTNTQTTLLFFWWVLVNELFPLYSNINFLSLTLWNSSFVSPVDKAKELGEGCLSSKTMVIYTHIPPTVLQ